MTIKRTCFSVLLRRDGKVKENEIIFDAKLDIRNVILIKILCQERKGN